LLDPVTVGLGAGWLAMVGTNIGAANYARAARSAWIAAALAAGVTAGIGLFGIVSPDAWTGLFSQAADIHGQARDYLVIAALGYPFLGLGLILASAFQGAGSALWPLVGISCRALVVIFGGWIVVHHTGVGLSGLALVAAGGLFIYGAVQAVAFHAGRWSAAARGRRG